MIILVFFCLLIVGFTLLPNLSKDNKILHNIVESDKRNEARYKAEKSAVKWQNIGATLIVALLLATLLALCPTTEEIKQKKEENVQELK